MIRTKKYIVCVDSVTATRTSATQRRVRVLDEVTMTPITDTPWKVQSEDAAVKDAIEEFYKFLHR